MIIALAMGKINDYSLGNGWNSSSAKRVPRLIISSLPRREYYVPPAAGQGLKCARAMARLLRALLPQAWSLGQCHPLEPHHTWSCLLKPQGYTASLYGREATSSQDSHLHSQKRN